MSVSNKVILPHPRSVMNRASANGPLALQNKRALWLLVVWLAGAVPLASAEGVLNYTVADWPTAGLGNARVRLAVSNNAEIVYAHVPWRRRDAEPERKATLLVDAATGKQLTNVIRVKVSRESGDFLFQPPTVPGEYYLYFLPFRSVGEWYFPTTLYLAPTNTADAAWTASCAPAMERIKEGKPAGVPTASVLDLQVVDDFHRFDPMEITATSEELKQFFGSHGSRPYLLFPEDRRDPIRMTEDLPLRWVQAGPRDSFKGEACRGEFYAFQVGLYASRQAIEQVSVGFGDLIGTDGARISATALRCFNLSGTNWLGQPIQKTVNVPKGKVQALWFGVAVPQDATAQTYRGTLTIGASNAPATSVALELAVSNQVLADAGDSEIWRQSRLRWLDSTIGLDDEVFAPYTPVQVEDRRWPSWAARFVSMIPACWIASAAPSRGTLTARLRPRRNCWRRRCSWWWRRRLAVELGRDDPADSEPEQRRGDLGGAEHRRAAASWTAGRRWNATAM